MISTDQLIKSYLIDYCNQKLKTKFNQSVLKIVQQDIQQINVQKFTVAVVYKSVKAGFNG